MFNGFVLVSVSKDKKNQSKNIYIFKNSQEINDTISIYNNNILCLNVGGLNYGEKNDSRSFCSKS